MHAQSNAEARHKCEHSGAIISSVLSILVLRNFSLAFKRVLRAFLLTAGRTPFNVNLFGKIEILRKH